MKKNILAAMLVLVVAFSATGLSGCFNRANNAGSSLTIYTTFYPIYNLTQKIVGDTAEVINLVPANGDAHDYELTPKQVVALGKADLIVANGLDMEHFIEDLSASILNKVLFASDRIDVLEIELPGGALKEDPHAWLSLKNAKIMLENIKNRIVELDATNANIYERNYQKHALLFDLLDGAYEAAVANFTSTTFVVSHRAFGYIARDYGLTQLPISGLETDNEADPATVAAIIDFINANNITTVFYQESVNAQVATAIANETGASVDMLSTIESLTSAQIAAGEDYLSMMAQNLVALINALS